LDDLIATMPPAVNSSSSGEKDLDFFWPGRKSFVAEELQCSRGATWWRLHPH
jgi:hypothetical protein